MIHVNFRKLAFVAHPVNIIEIQAIRGLLANVNGRAPSFDDVAELGHHNPEWIQTVRQEGRDGYVGAFTVLPLKSGSRKLIAANLMSGQELRIEHLATKGETPAGIYMGEVVALNDRFGRAATVKALQEKIEDVSEGYRTPVYTRPRTEEGLRLAERLGFRPVQGRSFELGDMNFVRRLSLTQ